MLYFDRTVCGAFTDNAQGRIPIDEETWLALLDEANSSGRVIGADEDGNPVVKDRVLTHREELEEELRHLTKWLEEHDYIGIKIATGRATAEEYAEEIALMREKAERVARLRGNSRGSWLFPSQTHHKHLVNKK